jgi:LPXTG-motif cell wall-anchored protein
MLLAQVKLEDVFKSTQENMNQGPGSERILFLILGALVLVALLVFLQTRRKKEAAPKAFNHPAKLVKEVLKGTPIDAVELRQLKQIAAGLEVENPLVLLLCPSLLARGLKGASDEQRRAVGEVIKKLR